MSLKDLFDAIKAELPNSLKSVFHLGARKLPQHAGPIRIVMTPTRDAFEERARQGRADPRELWGFQGGVSFVIEAPTHDDIDKPHGLRDLLLSMCHKVTRKGGSFRPVEAEWDNENGGSQSVRGECYTLRVVFGRPVLETSAAQATTVTTATPEEAPFTGTIGEP